MSRSEVKILPQSDIKNYRAIDRLSYSALKVYQSDRKKYRDLYVLKDEAAIKANKDKMDKSPFVRMGNLVDVRLTDGGNFDNQFVVTTASVPTGQMLTFCDFLYEFTLDDMNEAGQITTSLEERIDRAYEALKESNGGKLQSGLPKFVERFNNEGLEYFHEKLVCRGKTIVTQEEYEISESIVNSLLSSMNTKDILNSQFSICKFPILFKVGELDFKMELDWGVFDHNKKVLYPFDLKCTSNVEGFIWDGYLDSGYYIQDGLYVHGLRQWIATIPEYADYKVENMSFIVCDQKNYVAPLVFNTTDDNFMACWQGFSVGKKKYKGIYQLIEEVNKSIELDVWNMSIDNYYNKGVITIPAFEINED